ncbi:unnamed protein product [Mycena citricolor]|uniref:Uncharacterized protein n=1 Tax=Mycena citricolor TaxID=2018698 RepID=A0AAD2HTZ5_9AGAR|nr:unnamed protein product [Mycena citricolor]
MSHPSRARAAAAPTALKSRQPLLQATLGVFRKSTPAPKPWVRPRAPIILSTTHRRRDRASVRPILKRQTSRRRRDSDVSETSTLRGDADELELELEPMYQKQGVRGVDYYEVLVRTSGQPSPSSYLSDSAELRFSP